MPGCLEVHLLPVILRHLLPLDFSSGNLLCALTRGSVDAGNRANPAVLVRGYECFFDFLFNRLTINGPYIDLLFIPDHEVAGAFLEIRSGLPDLTSQFFCNISGRFTIQNTKQVTGKLVEFCCTIRMGRIG